MSTTAPVLEVSHLTKRFARDLRRSLRYGLEDIGRELVPRRRAPGPRPGEFPALDDVSFELHPGEALAVMGKNGAGKSTLLKVLHGLLKPDEGEVRLRGRLGALIELGTGFDPVLTGRENIAVNAAMVGLPPAELTAAAEEVIAFAELADAADTPVRFYSSGMTARLAFAVAAHLRPDVLVVDEVLAVGDFAFQRKCVRHMREYLDGGGSLVLVSHNAFLVQSLCSRGLLLEAGRCTFAGTAVETVTRYLASAMALLPAPGTPAGPSDGTGDAVTVEHIGVSGPEGGPLVTGEPVRVSVGYHCREPVENVIWGFGFWTGDDWVCVGGDWDRRPRRIDGTGEVTATLPRLPLLPGAYLLRATLVDNGTQLPLTSLPYGVATPTTFVVEAPPGLVLNAKTALHQLVTLDVDWEDVSEPAPGAGA